MENHHQQFEDEEEIEVKNTYSEVEEEPPKLTIMLLLTAFVIILGSFQYGFAIGVLNTPKEAISGLKTFTNQNQTINETILNECLPTSFYTPCVQMEPIQWNIFVSSFIVTALVGI